MRRWLPFILYNAGNGWTPELVVDAQAPNSPVALLSVDGPMGGLRRSPKAVEELDFSLEVKALADDTFEAKRFRWDVI